MLFLARGALGGSVPHPVESHLSPDGSWMSFLPSNIPRRDPLQRWHWPTLRWIIIGVMGGLLDGVCRLETVRTY